MQEASSKKQETRSVHPFGAGRKGSYFLPLTSCLSRQRQGFTLVETLVALEIMALIASSVVVVMNRCITSTTNLTLETQAFEVARQQMDQILAKASVQEMAEFGTSEQYPGIEWQTTVEIFEEPVEGATWARAVCSSTYEDVDGQPQTVELTCWLTRLTQDQLARLEQKTPDANDQLLVGSEAAADYAGVTVETIQEWQANGLAITAEGGYIKENLDLYKRTNGQPGEQEKQQQIRSLDELRARQSQTSEATDEEQTHEPNPIPPVMRSRIPERGNPEVKKK